MVTALMPDVKARPSNVQKIEASSRRTLHPDKAKHIDKAKKHHKDIEDIEGWLDRNQVSDLLGCSVATIRQLESREKLHPKRARRIDNAGAERLVYIYDPKEVAQVPRYRGLAAVRSPGEVAARCFELCDEGKSIREIVIELRESPDLIMGLREKWFDTGGADLVINPLARERLEVIVGPFKTVAELVERLEAIAGELGGRAIYEIATRAG